MALAVVIVSWGFGLYTSAHKNDS